MGELYEDWLDRNRREDKELRMLLGSRRILVVKRSEKVQSELFLPVRSVTGTTGVFRMSVMGRVGTSSCLIWRQPVALARGLIAKYKTGDLVLEVQ